MPARSTERPSRAANAHSPVGKPNLTVLKGLTAEHHELQLTVKEGANQPWADVRVRQAMNMAINRDDLLAKVFASEGVYSGHVPPGYGKWPLSSSAIAGYEKFDVSGAKALMSAAGFASGFTANLQFPSTNAQIVQICELLQSYMSAIGITVNLVSEDRRRRSRRPMPHGTPSTGS